MPRSTEQYFRSVISGRERGAVATITRTGLALLEPFYAMAVRTRNWMFDRRLRAIHTAARPVVCVGNLTTGGTGKTPVVRWLADELRRRGHRPAVLMRGYKAGDSGSDELRLLEELLNRDSALGPVRVFANPDRGSAARRAIETDPQITVFLLDDGFQHRRLKRDFDLVLIDSTNPLGHGHLLPRGLLREPPGGLRRASAMLLTHTESVSPDELARIERTLRHHNAWAPIYHCRHALAALLTPDDQHRPLDLRGQRFFAFCGIGNPEAFVRQLESTTLASCAGSRFFADHHAYAESDLIALERDAQRCGADRMLTTEKDWVKLAALPRARQTTPPIWRARLAIEFRDDDASKLIEQIHACVSTSAAPAEPLSA